MLRSIKVFLLLVVKKARNEFPMWKFGIMEVGSLPVLYGRRGVDLVLYPTRISSTLSEEMTGKIF